MTAFITIDAVADPGFDIRGGAWTLSLKVLKVEVKVSFNVFGHISSKIMLKINHERRKK